MKRTALKILRIALLWVPLSLIALVIVIFAALWLFLTPARVERLIVSGFNERSHGTIALSVKEFDLVRGFRIDNLTITNGPEFDNTAFVRLERLVFRYHLLRMLTGSVRFSEIGIYRPRIHLTQKNAVWNAARLMKPGEKKPEPEKPKEPETPTTADAITLPISVDFLLKFVLDDLRLSVTSPAFSSNVEGITLNVDVWVPPFKKIPKSIDAVSLLERLQIVLNPGEEINLSFYSKDAEVRPPLVCALRLAFDKKNGARPQFASVLRVGTNKTPVRFKRAHLAPLNFMVSYDLFYQPLTDLLTINHLEVAFLNKKWLRLTGTVNSVTAKQNINIRMTESVISLDDLYPYYRSITGDHRTVFRGTISLFPLTVQGSIADLRVRGALSARTLVFRNPAAEATLPSLTLAYTAHRRGVDMDITASLAMPHLFYTLNRNQSGDNGMTLTATVSAQNNFSRITIPGIAMRFFSPTLRRDVLALDLAGSVALKPTLSGRISISRLAVDARPLPVMVPRHLVKTVEGIPLKKPVTLGLDTDFSLGEAAIAARLALRGSVPDYDIPDLALGADIVQHKASKRVTINRFSLGSARKNLSITAGGFIVLAEPPFSDADLRLTLSYRPPSFTTAYGPWKLKGSARVDAAVKGGFKKGKATGAITVDKFFVKNDESLLAVDDININFPFEYYFTPRYTGQSRITVDKAQIIENEFFQEKQNVTVASVRAKHPARNVPMEYLKDLRATMSFRNNTFEIARLRAYVLDGALYGRNILFNLADMKKQNMEFNLVLDVTNVDIGKLDEQEAAKKKRDAELSLNANFKGHGLDISRELSMEGFINIHKIGDKFANRLLKGLSTEKGQSKLGAIGQFAVDNSMNVTGFRFNLDKGLVYATVTFSRRTFGYLLGVKNERVEFERMPIQEYLRKVQTGD